VICDGARGSCSNQEGTLRKGGEKEELNRKDAEGDADLM